MEYHYRLVTGNSPEIHIEDMINKYVTHQGKRVPMVANAVT